MSTEDVDPGPIDETDQPGQEDEITSIPDEADDSEPDKAAVDTVEDPDPTPPDKTANDEAGPGPKLDEKTPADEVPTPPSQPPDSTATNPVKTDGKSLGSSGETKESSQQPGEPGDKAEQVPGTKPGSQKPNPDDSSQSKKTKKGEKPSSGQEKVPAKKPQQGAPPYKYKRPKDEELDQKYKEIERWQRESAARQQELAEYAALQARAEERRRAAALRELKAQEQINAWKRRSGDPQAATAIQGWTQELQKAHAESGFEESAGDGYRNQAEAEQSRLAEIDSHTSELWADRDALIDDKTPPDLLTDQEQAGHGELGRIEDDEITVDAFLLGGGVAGDLAKAGAAALLKAAEERAVKKAEREAMIFVEKRLNPKTGKLEDYYPNSIFKDQFQHPKEAMDKLKREMDAAMRDTDHREIGVENARIQEIHDRYIRSPDEKATWFHDGIDDTSIPDAGLRAARKAHLEATKGGIWNYDPLKDKWVQSRP
jgi:hypothetical protein